MSCSIRSKNKSRATIKRLGVHSIRVRRSNKEFYAEVADPKGCIIAGLSTLNPEVAKEVKSGGNKDAAAKLAKFFIKKVKVLKIKKLAFDRSGYIYTGRVKAFAESLRSEGIIK